MPLRAAGIVFALGAAAASAHPWTTKAKEALAARPAAHRGPPAGLRAALGGRRLEEIESYTAECLGAFSVCEADEQCLKCVLSLVDQDDDSVELPAGADAWTCGSVVSFLHSQEFCAALDADSTAGGLLCAVWEACADEKEENATPYPVPAPVECSATDCDVPHPAWLGDGRCDRAGCYNTAACGWDRGDCCAATCEGDCAGPFACRDPEAQGCGSRARAEITAEAGASAFDYKVYSVILGTYAEVASATVEPGAPATQTACLADGCYVVEATADATFGDGASWTVKTRDRKTGELADAPAAAGGAPSVCTFAVGEGSNEYCPAGCAPSTKELDECAADDTYEMELFDAGFNGWGFVGYSVHAHDTNGKHGEVVKEGTLAAGHFGVDTLCLTKPGCYTVTLAWGWWAEEVSWVLGKAGEGAVATGGAPAQCDFSVGGDFCPATCAVEPELPELTGGCDPDDASKLPYALELYDAEGDGWQGAGYEIVGDDGVVASGTLLGGFQGEDDLCLAPGCYDFAFSPGKGNAKPAWALGDPTEGGAVFSGARSADCAFAVGGGECPTGAHSKDACGFAGSETPPPTSLFACPSDEALLVMRVTDSFGDGWNGADFSVKDAKDKVVAEATLKDGAYKEFPYCLKPGCYTVETTSGEWHDEVSWQAVELLPGGGALIRAHGAAPEACGLELTAGDGEISDASTCDSGCETRAAASDDWLGGDDDYWGEVDDAYAYYAYDEEAAYGEEGKPPPRCAGGTECTVKENFMGWDAATKMSDCLGKTVLPSRQDNPFDPQLWEERPELCLGTYDFGELDAFEECANQLTYSRMTLEGKEQLAKKCMALLVSAAPDGSEDLQSDDELVKRLATMVYYAGDAGFCDCATDELSIPHCADFDDFRAVVREAHEACDALDLVDCAYLGAYADACRTALVNEFGSLDLSDTEQCRYVDERGCGGLPIPAVRRWDCLLEDNYELTDSQRQLILDVVNECGEATDDGRAPAPAPAPAYATDDGGSSGSHHHHRGSADEGASAGMVVLVVLVCLASAVAGAALLYCFYFKPQRRFDDSDLGAQFTPVPNSGFGEYEAPAGTSPFGDGTARSETRNPMLPL
mmetsp:Transcript_10562/g.32528  ORF Transcript_10562/g.32528 Transcript_10562/m.32528 type:complete len:1099 (+) Transcript_10562:371-3667(+)